MTERTLGGLFRAGLTRLRRLKRKASPASGSAATVARANAVHDPAAGGKRLVGFGHSHLSAYLKAWTERCRAEATRGDAITLIRLIHKNFQPNFETVAGHRQVAPALEQRIRHILRRDTPDAVFCVLMGNEYNSLAMVRHPEPFDFDYPARPGHPAETANPAATRIAFGAMRAQMADLADRNALLLWRTIAASTDRPVFLIPPPPPIPDEAHIRAHPGKFGALVTQHGLNPPDMRRRMWRLYCEVLREGSAGGATTFVDLPETVFDDGYLARKFWQGDPTHANGDYGELMLTHLRQMAFGS